MKRLLLASCALVGCTLNDGLAPDAIELSYGIGDSEFDNSPLRGFGSEIVMVSGTWNLLARSRNQVDGERWAATQRHQETMRELAVGHLAQEARVSSADIEDALVAHDETHADADADLGRSFGSAITSEPETVEGAYTRLLWAGSILMLALGAIALHRSGTLKALLGVFRGK